MNRFFPVKGKIGNLILIITPLRQSLLQITVLSGNVSKPIFITGDFNSEVGSDTIKEMQKTWKLISTTAATFSSSNPKKCIDFIFVKPNGAEVVVQKTGVPRAFSSGTVSTASDHLPVFVDVTF